MIQENQILLAPTPQPTDPTDVTTKYVEQGTDEWFDARLGLATASRFKDVLATIKNGESAARRNYRAELVVERLTGKPLDRFKTAAMEWGNDTEDLARMTYMLITGNKVKETGFWKHPVLEAGASPDGLVGKDGLIEIKCKNLANHIEVLRIGRMPKEHEAQVQGQMLMTNRKWCDFVSFAPELPENAQTLIVRVERDNNYIANLLSELETFLNEVEDEVNFIKNYK
jgi:predicted phage-related endonuclease